MTKKLFWIDPYLTTINTRITSVTGNDVTLQETIFYAFSGAQESDHGTISNKHVEQAQKVDKDIIYTLENTQDLQIGAQVVVTIDWNRRYRLMRLHFAAELVLELVFRHLPGIEKSGAHISQDKARIDFKWPHTLSSILPQIKEQAHKIIDADLPIISAFSDEENQKRYWQIEGFAQVSCGGTHPKKTSEIGHIILKRDNRGKSQERIIITLE